MSNLGPIGSTMADMRESETVEEQKLAEILLNREIMWSDMPHTMRKGTMGFLEPAGGGGLGESPDQQ